MCTALTENCRCSLWSWRHNGFHFFQFRIHALLSQHRNILLRFVFFNYLALCLEGISSSQHGRRTHRLLRQIPIGDRHRSTLVKASPFGNWISIRAAFEVPNILVLRRLVLHFRLKHFASFCSAWCLRFVTRVTRISVFLDGTRVTLAIFRIFCALIRC